MKIPPNRPDQPGYRPNIPQRPNQPTSPGYGYAPNPSYPPSQPGQMNQPPQPQPSQSQTMHFAQFVLLPMRLFLGITFIYAGIQKLMDPQFFNPSARGYIGKQLIAFATGSPLHNLLIHLVPHATLIGGLVAYGEIAIGLGTLFGILFRLAAFFGILINLVFFLSATWHVYPYFYGSDIVFIFCWLTLMLSGPVNTGLPSVDGWFVYHVLSDEQRTDFAPAIAFFLGVPPSPAALPAPAPSISAQGRQATSSTLSTQQNRYGQLQRAQQQSRRSFLWGLVTGGAGIAVLAWIGGNLSHLAGRESEGNVPISGGSSTGSPSPTGTATASGTQGSNVIAQINAVPKNSSASFTLASNGDPGILVHLSNGQFVAYDATCTHAGCPVSYDSGSQALVCPCHGAAFDPAHQGTVLQGPAQTPLTQVTIQVNNANGTITTNQ